jgi:hypothetical protein
MKKQIENIEIQEEDAEDRQREINRTIKLTKEFLARINYKRRIFAKQINRIIANHWREIASIIKNNTDRLYLESCVALYYESMASPSKSLNPIFLWEAYRFARENNLDIPDQVLSYLDECAENILKIKSAKGDSGVLQLDHALVLKDKLFSQYHLDNAKLKEYILIEKMIAEGKHNISEIFSIVSNKIKGRDDPDYHGAGTVSKHYYEFRKRMSKAMVFREIKINNKDS